MYLLDIKNENAKTDHWLGSPLDTNITSELDQSNLFDLNYLRYLIKNDSMQGFYMSAIWLKTRQVILKRDRYECQRCKKHHVLTTTENGKGLYIHHICELKKYPHLCLNQSILVTVCWECHETIHGRNISLADTQPFENFDSDEIIL